MVLRDRVGRNILKFIEPGACSILNYYQRSCETYVHIVVVVVLIVLLPITYIKVGNLFYLLSMMGKGRRSMLICC